MFLPATVLAQIQEINTVNIIVNVPNKPVETSVVNGRSLKKYLVQGGGFLSTLGGGMEITWRPGLAPWYGNFSLSSMMNPGERIPEANRIFTAGIMVGYERMFYSTQPQSFSKEASVVYAGADGTQFYIRVGPGIGVAGVGKINSHSLEYYPLIHSTAVAGTLLSVAENISIYFELGGRMAWTPTLDEMRFLAGPQLNIGIQFSSISYMKLKGF